MGSRCRDQEESQESRCDPRREFRLAAFHEGFLSGCDFARRRENQSTTAAVACLAGFGRGWRSRPSRKRHCCQIAHRSEVRAMFQTVVQPALTLRDAGCAARKSRCSSDAQPNWHRLSIVGADLATSRKALPRITERKCLIL